MTKLFTKAGITAALSLSLLAGAAQAQSTDTSDFKPHGKLWGYAFGDYAFKGSTDQYNRGGSNQYTGVPAGENEFQFRRIYLGYSYEISKKFVAEFLLAAEDDFQSGLNGSASTGDLLANNKFSPYVKLANLRWRNFWKNTDLVIGQSPTPTFAQGAALKEYARNTQTSEEVWGYRSIERTITDIRRTSSYDMGVALQGWFTNNGNFGYDLMVANGTGDKPEGDKYKWFYGDVYAKFFNKRLIVDLYQDYNRLADSMVKGPNVVRRSDRNMTKLFLAWNTQKFTVGFEGFQNTLMGDVAVTGKDGNTYYRTTKSIGLSFFAKAALIKDKLNVFGRFDNYDPSGNLDNIVNESNTKSYKATTSQYDPSTKEQFFTFGFDYTPMKNVHIMPNVWINNYQTALSKTDYSMNAAGVPGLGTDAVYRLTFYYIYGK